MSTTKAAILFFPRNQFSSRFGETFYTFEMKTYEKKKDENCCSHKDVVYYDVTVLQGKTRHNVSKRYSEFLQLFEDIKELDPDLVIDTPPSKSLYLFFYNDPTYIDQRRQSLADYLERLLLALHNRGVPITFYRPIITFLKLGGESF